VHLGCNEINKAEDKCDRSLQQLAVASWQLSQRFLLLLLLLLLVVVLGCSNPPAGLPYMTPELRSSPATRMRMIAALAPTPFAAPFGAHPACRLVVHTERSRQGPKRLRMSLHQGMNLKRRKAAS